MTRHKDKDKDWDGTSSSSRERPWPIWQRVFEMVLQSTVLDGDSATLCHLVTLYWERSTDLWSRPEVLRWLQEHSAECDAVMEHVVQTITLSYDQTALPRAKQQALRARHWASLVEQGHVGRFVPDTELGAHQDAAERIVAAQTFEEFLRAQTHSIDTEVNVQLGEYTLKNNTLQPLSPSISASPDFVSVFGVSRNANPIQCVEVQRSTRRNWLRLVGQRRRRRSAPAGPRAPPRRRR